MYDHLWMNEVVPICILFETWYIVRNELQLMSLKP